MENASKALIMAAEVIIGLLVLSLAVYLIVSFGSNSAALHKRNEQQQIDQFNAQFTSYEEKACTIYDVVTLANLATETNKYYEFNKKTADGNDDYISVIFKNATNSNLSAYNNQSIEKGLSDSATTITNYYNGLISADLKVMPWDAELNKNVLQEYRCQTVISETTGRVYKVVFNKK